MAAAPVSLAREVGRRFSGSLRAASGAAPTTLPRLLAVTLSIVLCYAALGRLGVLIAVPPSYVAIFWPASGLAVAAALVIGRRALPGIGLGALALHLSLLRGELAVLTAMLIACGAVLEVCVVMLLRQVRHAFPAVAVRHSPLADGLWLLALLLPATMLGAAVGTAALLLGGEVAPAAAAEVWMVWWLGEFAGAIGLAPLLVCGIRFCIGKPLHHDPVVLSLAGLLAGAGLFGFGLARLDDQATLRGELRSVADRLLAGQAAYLDDVVARALALRAHFAVSGAVTSEGFGEFARLTHDRKEVARALAWAPRVSAADLPAFAAKLVIDGQRGQGVFEQGAAGARVAVGARAEYFPLQFVWPPENALRPRGFDLASEARRREAIERAADSGRPMLSAPLSPAGAASEDAAALVVAPVYRRWMPLDSVAERREALAGVTVVAFNPARVLAGVRQNALSTDTEIFVFDRPAGGGEAKLLAWQASRNGPQMLPENATPEALRLGAHVEKRLEFGGREWLLLLRPGRAFFGVWGSWNGWIALGFCFLLASTLLNYLGRRETQERSLRELEAARLDEAEFTARLLEQLPIGVALVAADGHIVDTNAAFTAIVGHLGDDFSTICVGAILPTAGAGRAGAAFGPVEGEFRHSAGHLVPVRVRGLLIERDGAPAYLTVAEDISERRKAEFQLAQAQKMEAIGQLTGGLAHDFNNMLGIVIGNLDLCAASFQGDVAQRARLDTALSAALRGADLTRALLAVARRRELDPEPVELNAWLGELLPLIRHTAGPKVSVRTILEGSPVVNVDPGGVASVILNLVLNARDAMPERGCLTLSTARRRIVADDSETLAPGDYVALNVSDTGCGMSVEVLERAIDPFFTTKERGRGTGLGLAMAHGFARQSGGDLRIFSRPGVGTTVKILLPVAATARPRRVDDLSLPRGNERVLVVDDEVDLLAVTADWLGELGYEVSACPEPEAALVALEEAQAVGRPFALLISDIVMPRMDGLALADAALAIQPELPVLLMSGFADPERCSEERPDGEILEKPFRLPELARAVRRRLASAEAGVSRRRCGFGQPAEVA